MAVQQLLTKEVSPVYLQSWLSMPLGFSSVLAMEGQADSEFHKLLKGLVAGDRNERKVATLNYRFRVSDVAA